MYNINENQDIFARADRVRIVFTDSSGNTHTSFATPVVWRDGLVSWIENTGVTVTVAEDNIVDVLVLENN
jgi:hypothetical protein